MTLFDILRKPATLVPLLLLALLALRPQGLFPAGRT